MTSPTLLLLADSRFPSGAHAHSAGVEAALRAGDVTDVDTLARYLRGRLATTGVTDAAFAACTVGSIERNTGFDLLDTEYDARVLSPRLRATSRRLGRQLCRTASATFPHHALDAVGAIEGGPHQPVALGAAVVAAGGGPDDAAVISVHQLANAAVTAGVRLLALDPIGCAAMQAELAAWMAGLVVAAPAWSQLTPAELPGAGGTLTEILAEHHGTWDHRLFVA
jgi:urease accessory protein